MSYVEAHFSIKHECPLCQLTLAHPGSRLLLWCDNMKDVLEIATTDETMLSTIITEIDEMMRVANMMSEGNYGLVISRTCVCEPVRSISSLAGNHGCWLVPPCAFKDGIESHRAISNSKLNLRSLIEDIESDHVVHLDRLAEREDLSSLFGSETVTSHVLEGLTEKQLVILASAYENGLMDIPSKRRMEDVAQELGISHATYSEHLHKGIRSLIKQIYPYLRLTKDKQSH